MGGCFVDEKDRGILKAIGQIIQNKLFWLKMRTKSQKEI